MLKTILLSGILLSLSTLAFADNYSAATDQGIYAFGPYIGMQFGYGTVEAGNSDFKGFLRTQGDVSEKYHWLGSSFMIGWSFVRFFSIEGGYTDFPDLHYNLTTNNQNGTTKYEYIYETKSWDVVGKLALPLSVISHWLRRWDIYGKGGIGYISGVMSVYQDNEYQGHTEDNVWRPVYELGIDFNFNKYLFATASWTRFNGTHNLKYGVSANQTPYVDASNTIPTVDLFSIGLTFKFANLFEG